MAEVTLDTSFLITFADTKREHHAVAVNYFRHFVANKIPMYVSAIVAGEFAIKQSLEDLPLQNLRLRAYDVVHAKRSASLYNLNKQHLPPTPDGPRSCVINDLKILAQTVEDKIPFLLTEDENTLAKIVRRLYGKRLIEVDTILLKDGFRPEKLNQTEASELFLQPPLINPG